MKAKWLLIFALVVALIVIGISLPIHSNVNLLDPTSLTRHQISHLGLALSSFAGDHGGKFPRHLSELSAGELPDADQIRMFRDPTTKKAQEWLYFPGYTTSDPPDTILTACPVTTDAQNKWILPVAQKRVIWTVAGRTEAISELKFQQRLKAQSNDRER